MAEISKLIKIKVKYKDFRFSYISKSVRWTGDCERGQKDAHKKYRILDLFLSIISSTLSIFRSAFVW